MRLRLIRLSVIPAAFLFISVVGCNELVATEPGVESTLYGTPQFSQASADTSARGHVDLGQGEGNRGIDRYSFTARLEADGTARGEFQLFTNVGTDFETHIHGEVTCLSVQPDGTARLGGTITRSDPELPEGQPLGVIWTVRDGGEGRNSQDTGSLMLFGIPPEITEQLCSVIEMPPLSSNRGNIQVTAR